MELGVELIGMVKTITKRFCKETIENLTKDLHGGSYLLLRSKPMVPGYRPIIAIGYKSIMRGSFYLLLLRTTQATQRLVFPIFLSILTNSLMLPFTLLLVPLLYQLFSVVNEVDSHNKSIQSDLALEKWWVTQYGWLRLCKKVAMGMTITNCWKLFRYGVKREHYDKLIDIR